jgi:hypothetical protein
LYEGGRKDTYNGDGFPIYWSDLAELMQEYAGNFVPKGEGWWMTPAISTNGRCRDCDVAWITQLSLDAEMVGEWHQLIKILRAAELSFIAARSARHTPDLPRFHVHLPLWMHWTGDKSEWRAIFRHCIAWFSVVAGLRYDLDTSPPLYGFDHATDRMGQPWFLSARRDEQSPTPEVLVHTAGALDLEQLLRLTGFVFDEPVQRKSVRRQRARAQRPADGSAPESLLERAFAAAGWLGPRLSGGGRAALCPWEGVHTTGTRFDGSTVLFPPTREFGRGWFHCSHTHCRDRSQQDVLLALPPAALQAAIAAEGRKP